VTNKAPKEDVLILLSDKENELLKAYAAMYGLSMEEAATKLVTDGIAKRIKRNTGKTPAKVYGINRKR
jgi:predicted transcriptional regulator